MDTYLILHDIRSAHNVGSIFRTADAAGVAKIYLTGYTPTPTDRFGRVQGEIKKTSLGATETVLWEYHDDIYTFLRTLKEQSIRVIAVEQDSKAVDYAQFVQQTNTAFIFGNEVTGVPAEVLDRCDQILEIPMHGTKESLNVSVAAGIILFNTR